LIVLNDFVAQWSDIKDDALSAVDRVGQSGWLILGQEVANFETALAKFWQMPHAIGVANGLDAIEISLRALGLKEGEKVLTTPLSAFATSLAIIRAGGRPVFVDTDSSGLLNLDQAEELLSKDSSLKFMVPVHLFGHALDLNRLEELKNKFNLKIVEDCAQSIGARSHDRVVGSVGQMAATSFYPTKNLGCMGDGGAIITGSELLDKASRTLRDYGQSKKYVHDVIGLNSRLDELQAAILFSAFLPRLGALTAKRIAIAQKFRSNIKNKKIKVIDSPAHSNSVWHLFPVIVDGDRAAFQNHLKAQGVSSGIHYPILITEQKALESLNLKGSYPEAKKIADQEVSLPIHPYLSENDISKVIEACISW
jgi:dTDP-3-amino-3,4,6-trideoxy-alpha-D-glucose transaminase